jgi:hypothetical protein
MADYKKFYNALLNSAIVYFSENDKCRGERELLEIMEIMQQKVVDDTNHLNQNELKTAREKLTLLKSLQHI